MKNSPKTQAYFDCNATTPVLPAAAEASLEAMKTLYGNPSSTHLVGLQAKSILESTRKKAAHVIGAEPEQVIFTSGATEGIQTAVFSALQACKADSSRKKIKLLYGATEHKVIPQALHHWVKALGLSYEIVELPVDSYGQIVLEVLRKELPDCGLLCTMAVNNETGVIQNLAAIENELIQLGSKALWLVDCVQALGKTQLNLSSHRMDYAAFSGHKLYAPKGIGFLYVKKNSPFTPLIVGGGQEKGLRSGTENIPGVAALGAVLELLIDTSGKSPFQSHERLMGYRNKIVAELKNAFPKVEFNTPLDHSVPTTINFSVPGLTSGELMDLFDSAGIRLSAGSACSSGSAKPSHVLDSMGISLARSIAALRLSFGPCTSEEEVERGCKTMRECAIALKTTCLLEAVGAFEAPENLRDGVIQFRAASSNSWILADRESRSCIIIDPCDLVAERMEHYIRCQNLKVHAILDTHSHGDHESIRPLLQKILAHQMEAQGSDSVPFDSLGWPVKGLTSVALEDGTRVPAICLRNSLEGDRVLASLETPGHTLDSRAFLYGIAKNGILKRDDIHFAFSGDTVLSGGLGRTNFTVSDPTALFHSLRKMEVLLSPMTLLCPAHDYNNSFATSLKTEKEENSLLALALGPMSPMTLEHFLSRKRQIDQDLTQLEENFQGVVCGVTQTKQNQEDLAVSLPADKLEEFLYGKATVPLVVDVREPQEYSLTKDWNAFGLKAVPRNVPLSRFVNFMEELLRQRKHDQEIVFLCKSGARSLHAAKSLRRLGFTRVQNLDGGLVGGSCQ